MQSSDTWQFGSDGTRDNILVYLELSGDPITIPGVSTVGEDGHGEPG